MTAPVSPAPASRARTATRPAGPVASPPGPADPRPRRARDRHPWDGSASGWLVGVACGLSVLLASVALQPLLRGGWWLPMTAQVVALITVVGIVTRGLRAPAPVQPAVQAVALVVLLLAGFTTGQGDVGRFEQLRLLAAQGRHYAEVTAPPAGPDLGLLLLLVGGLGLAAIAVDTLAAGIDLPGLALIPLAAIFAVPWVIGDLHAAWWTFAVVGLAWLVVLAATQHHRLRAWSPQARPGSLGVGLLAAVATLCAGVLGGALTASRDPLSALDLRWGAAGGAVQLDNMVSLRRSLVGNDDRVVLRYTTTAQSPDYFRTAVLEDFDGERWLDPGAGFLAETMPTGTDAGPQQLGDEPAQYAIDVGPLAGTVVPSPWGTVASASSWPAVWNQRSAILRRMDGSSVTSSRALLVVLPRQATAEQMRAASTELSWGMLGSPPTEALPYPYPQAVVDLAREVTVDATTPYDKAVALQRWFAVSGGFSYSTDIEDGSGADALLTFLSERIGYCEQFAAAMASMARVLDIPSRVAVGFTQGTQQDDGSWLVRASDAHAWPELWLGAAGWVRFEPTPGAATTRTPAYTSDASQGGSAPVLPSAASPGASTDAQYRPRTLEDDPTIGGEADAARQAPWWLWLLALAAILGSVPALVRSTRRTRRLRRGDPESAYAEVVDTAADVGLSDLGQTPRTALAAIQARLTDAGLADAGRVRPGDHSAGSATAPAVQRLAWALAELRAGVERARYGPSSGDEAAPTQSGPSAVARRASTGTSGAGAASRTGAAPAGAAGAGTALLEGPAADSDRGGPAQQARVIAAALHSTTGRAGCWRVRLLPRSVLSGWLARLTGTSGPSASDADEGWRG